MRTRSGSSATTPSHTARRSGARWALCAQRRSGWTWSPRRRRPVRRRRAPAVSRSPTSRRPPDRAGRRAAVSTDHERHNRDFWDRDADAYQELHGDTLHDVPRAWGAWRIPEQEVGALGDVDALDVLELGCGAAQWSVALAEEGGHPVGLDLSASQLRHARRRASEAGMVLPLVLASGEAVPLRDA